MTTSRFRVDHIAGSAAADLFGLLFVVLFVLAMLVARAASDELQVPPSGDRASQPIRVTAAAAGDGYSFSVEGTGGRGEPATGSSNGVLTWLAGQCPQPRDRTAARPPVVLTCPDDMTHARCKRALVALGRRAPHCAYRY